MSSSKVTLPPRTKIPDHIAIIPDGNRRWARSRNLPTLQGHKRGAEAAMSIIRASRDLGVHTITFWGLSTENWNRSSKELSYLMKIYLWLIKENLKEAHRDGVRVIHLGRKDRLPKILLGKLKEAEELTKDNTKHIFNIALDYGGHDEIIRATQAIVRSGVKAEEITKELFERYLDTKDQPYPYVDLLIRSSGEQRTSGLLPWQMEYAEMYWEYEHFPDFSTEKLRQAILDYSRRRRRFGGNDAVEHFDFKPEMTAKFELAWWRLQKIPEGMPFKEYAMRHLREQYGLSKQLAGEGAKFMALAVLEGNRNQWDKAKMRLKGFYKLIKEEVKLAFEPEIVAGLEVKLWKEMNGRQQVEAAGDGENTARELYAEVYRISLLQAAKLAHLRVLAKVERNLALAGYGEQHWHRAEDYLEKFYRALKDRVA